MAIEADNPLGEYEPFHDYTTCSQPNCPRPKAGRGLCIMHYKRAWRRKELDKLPLEKPRHLRSNKGEHKSWWEMIRRCQDETRRNYFLYGGRGIKVCDRWQKFENFYEDMGARPEGMTLDRIDNDGNYEPGNCRWATPQEQAINRRSTRFYRMNDKVQSLSQWTEELNLSYKKIYSRISRGYSFEDAIKDNVRSYKWKTQT